MKCGTIESYHTINEFNPEMSAKLSMVQLIDPADEQNHCSFSEHSYGSSLH